MAMTVVDNIFLSVYYSRWMSERFSRGWFKIMVLLGELMSNLVEVARNAKKLGQEDPRRIVHSFKVGLAIISVSIFFYFEPLYEGFGVSAMWAVLTVVVVFEFSVGATLGKGINRGIATFVAGILSAGAHFLASYFGDTLEPILLGLSVFLLAAVVTFTRFLPRMKARYDYGLSIFILTYSLVCVSAYRDDEVLYMAKVRLFTILIGGATAVLICIFICPVWAGNDLQNQVASNIEKLGAFLEGFGDEYFKASGDTVYQKPVCQDYRSILNSKSSEDSLANFAKWEPSHGQFRYRHPWDHYLKIGALTRQCAYRIEYLNGYLNSDIQTPEEIQARIQEPCSVMCSESSYALKGLALSMKTMTRAITSDSHIANTKNSAENLKSLLKTGLLRDVNLLEIIPAVTVASLLIDIVTCTENISESIHELASLAHFNKSNEAIEQEQPQITQLETQGADHVITVHGPSSASSGNDKSSVPTTV